VKVWRQFAAMPYMLGSDMFLRIRTSAALAGLALLVSACAPSLGPPPPGFPRPRTTPSAPTFSAADFAWSKAAGHNSIVGKLTYRQGQTKFSCAGAGVVLTPETPWSRRRMAVLYGPGERAALPAAEVRSRTSSAPAGDPGPFVKRTTCDANSGYSFFGLPDGAWYVIALARPVGQPRAEGLAVMRRVVTKGGRITSADL
jgi:hypothetical protein